MEKTAEKKPVLIIDGYGFIFRAYHVQPPLTSPAGAPVGALYGFVSMLLKLINDFKPEHAVIVLDHGGKNFRHDLYKEYKANRPPVPDDLIAQLKLVRTAAEALNFTCLSKQGFEADDIIATLATKATSIKRNALIISSDKDLMQLVNEHVRMYDPAKAKHLTDEDIFNKFGVPPSKVREAQSLIGDASDNIPGVAGIGVKTAALLINEFGDLDGVLASIDKIKSKRQQNLLTEYRDNALLSWKLVGLDCAVEIDQDIENFHWAPPKAEEITAFLNEYGFKSLNKRIENLFNIKSLEPSAQESKANKQRPERANITQGSIVRIENPAQLEPLFKEIEICGMLAVNIHQNGTEHELVLCAGADLYIVPYIAESPVALDLFSYTNSKSSVPNFNKQIHELLENKAIKKITYNLKELLKLCDCKIQSAEDLQLMDYVLSAGGKSKNLAEIIEFYTHNKPGDNGTNQPSADETSEPGDLATSNLGKKTTGKAAGGGGASITSYFIACYKALDCALIQDKTLYLYKSIDLPLCHILRNMEKEGVKINTQHLVRLSGEFAQKISKLEKEIFAITGKEFNIASPKQLGQILFDEMKLPFAKMTGKTKSYSTNAEILEKLQDDGHKIGGLLLEYRHFTKLKNTYTDALPKQTDPRSGRIHTTFLQALTSTGRLSSANPNVQNIPTRTPEGSSIREAFVASEGNKLISADYSQVELRILSHIANIEPLKQAFRENRDIHAQTASQVFELPLDKITPEIRRSAKAINFGIIYGMSAFGLARGLAISKQEAADYIEKYFKEYPGIQKYMSETIIAAKENSFVANMLGRKCFLPSINNKNHTLRSFGERAAINAPMQSLASDIVKIAMIKLDQEFTKRSMKTKMILQIHDELIFESPSDEVESATKLIKSIMEGAFSLDVNLDAGISSGSNWREIH
ncbi:MAG: DNA polymerase I [Rickettsiales bacterium]|nr:MAG: DNA polymerase I [Rickettsiales bacterium]